MLELANNLSTYTLCFCSVFADPVVSQTLRTPPTMVFESAQMTDDLLQVVPPAFTCGEPGFGVLVVPPFLSSSSDASARKEASHF